MKWISYEPMDSHVHICFVFEVQHVQLCQISIQLPIATNLRTRLRRSLQSLARDIIESLGADHVAIFGDKAALDVLSFFREEDGNIQQVRSSIIQIRLAIVLLGAETSHIFHFFGVVTTIMTCELQHLRRTLWR